MQKYSSKSIAKIRIEAGTYFSMWIDEILAHVSFHPDGTGYREEALRVTDALRMLGAKITHVE